jgi:hypothetical protein
MVPPQLLKEIKTLNLNIEWLKRNRNSVEKVPNAPELMEVKETLATLDKSRNWLKSKMVPPEFITGCNYSVNANWFFIFGVDWHREGSKIFFKTDSVFRMKKELVNMGVANEKSLKN